ncbi:putative rhamnosyl transferase [Roseibacterium beibuensis]|uniref:Glycosyltransferase n=1 Tax=[Roseibacterium] beibuensis TaxID=1193142 RepID=A0ABP9L9K4_9RHOB|nr:putative rhamnosyl transferase [Roseibacterium beibuensis]MCS6627877.1 putative rhamnosyl transferase [Roseibacterium beibuensis]
MGAENQIVGVCRFSYLGEGGFQAQKGGFEKAQEELYAIPRMRRRFAYFENICLPSLAAQTDQNFRLVALIGDTMPYRWRKRLKGLMGVYPFLEVCTLEAAGPLNSTRRAFRRGVDGEPDFITGFRIDDDDAVAVDYIERTRAISDKLIELGWADAETPAAVCFHRGIYWDMNRPENERFYDFSEKEPLGLASAMVTTLDSTSNIFRWNHRKLAAHVRCWIDPTDYMFVRTLHGHNDSDRSIPPGARQLPDWQARTLLRKRFSLAPKKIIPQMAELQTEDE